MRNDMYYYYILISELRILDTSQLQLINVSALIIVILKLNYAKINKNKIHFCVQCTYRNIFYYFLKNIRLSKKYLCTLRLCLSIILFNTHYILCIFVFLYIIRKQINDDRVANV